MGIDEHVCPVCGQPVATVVRRHKTLGAWVPVWSPGPCRNHECAAYVDEAVEAAEAAAKKPRAVARRTQGSHGAHGGDGAHGGPDTGVGEADPRVGVPPATTEAPETPGTPEVRTEEKA
ncbi:hypothetical protein ACSCB1_15620 [Streptomyces europaeiscabiei]|uniref:Uncharacterized protein n=1 Tax=Streptomyces europaeiscabiei TaxID=146819 RepID=A0ABU4NF84_9ACTN|nr:hypothetical protein [Streptomyces europaeiscabiei]MDX2526088.1 hypothetical protein [Streptomyces europaeiscabiei]MDX2759610.1 hypothetical protein [Streptomyces europaeiscabiei]MDX2775248.1 hypothetical protein [Streptomyces europaeiscabiei]MDX3543431.1 hypothetical protein [Streptomyces europaeiscabiei]MDX3553247.1 hypothetical protein [Streptomyces europaeiscabiei]